MAYCYIFVDESGNLDFSNSGTEYWTITSLITEDIRRGVMELYDLKHKLIALGTDLELFHASEDPQAVRDEVFSIIKELDNIRVYSLIVHKRKVPPLVRPIRGFYPDMVEQLLAWPFNPNTHEIDVKKYEKVLFIFDRAANTKPQRRALVAGVKHYLADHLVGIPYSISMHTSASHPYLQIVDYLSWAIYVREEKGETRPYNEVRRLVKREYRIWTDTSLDKY